MVLSCSITDYTILFLFATFLFLLICSASVFNLQKSYFNKKAIDNKKNVLYHPEWTYSLEAQQPRLEHTREYG